MAVKGDEVKVPLDVEAIKLCIPHRYPFLLIDRVTAFKVGESITAYKNISYGDPIFQGHFPNNPVVPGVLIVEGIAQAAAVLGHLSSERGLSTCMLTEISETRFRKPVIPGDTLVYQIKCVKFRSPFYWFEAEAIVEDQPVASVKFSAVMK